MIVSILITSICMWLAYVLLCRRFFPVNEQVATCPGKWPLIGHALQLMNTKEASRNLMAFGEYSAKIGDVVTFYIGPIPVYVVTDPEDVATVVNKCLDKLFVYRFIEPMVGKEMVAADVPTWKRNRKVLDLCFKQHILDDYLQLFNERAERFVETIAEDVGQGEVDLKKKISRSVLETTCRTTLGINRDGMNDINDNYAKAINDCLDTLSDRIYKPWLIVDAVFNLSSDKRKLDKALETIFEFSEKTILLRKAERIQCLQKNEDFNHKGDNLSQLVYLDAVVKEAIRLYPVGPLVGRTTTTHTKLRNVTIPAGSSVVVHIWGINRNPRQWGSDAEEFRPERWLDSTMPKHQAAFATFGPGKRGCVGKTYALMYIKATVVSLLRKYKITADHKKLKLECKIMFKPLSGHLIEIEERNK